MGASCSTESSTAAKKSTARTSTSNSTHKSKPKAAVDPTVRTENQLADYPVPYKPSQKRHSSNLPQIAEVRPPTPSSTQYNQSHVTIPNSITSELSPLIPRKDSAMMVNGLQPFHPGAIPEPPRRETSPSVENLDRFDPRIQRLLRGDVNTDLCPRVRSLHVHTIACPGDADVEVGHLMREVYPKIRHSYARKGFDVEFLDPCWGWDDRWLENPDARQVAYNLTEACLNGRRDTQCLYVILLNEKVETSRLPFSVYQDDFEFLMNNVPDDRDLELLKVSYALDENCIPPSYKLQTTGEGEEKEQLLRISRETLPSDQLKMYFSSLFSRQIRRILDGRTEPENVLCFRRKFNNFPPNLSALGCERHFDVVNNEIDEFATKELNELSSLIEKKLSEKHIIEDVIPWSEGGVSSGNTDDVIKYTNQFVQNYGMEVQQWIERAVETVRENEDHSVAISWRSRVQNIKEVEHPLREDFAYIRLMMQSEMSERLYGELQHHASVCRELSKNYTRTDDCRTAIAEYLKRHCELPLILTGSAGSGKSTLLASVLDQLLETPHWQGGAAVVRFCHTSANCRTLDQLIHGIVQQLGLMFQKRPTIKTAEDYARVVRELLTDVPFPVLLVLDALDQVEAHHVLTRWQWMPRRLPHNVWLIVSVGIDKLPHLKHHFPDETEYLTVPPLSTDDAFQIITNSLESCGRTISEKQRLQIENVLDTFETTPLTAKILADVAAEWHRDDLEDIPSDPAKLMKHYLNSLDKKFGKITRKALYSMSKITTGLSHQEGLNLISCHSDELKDGERYLAPMHWFALCEDLKNYTIPVSARGIRSLRIACLPIRNVALEYKTPEYNVDLRVCFTHPDPEYTAKEFVIDLTQDSCYLTHSPYRAHTEFTRLVLDTPWDDDIPNRLTDFKYLYYKIKGSDVFHVMGDIQRILQKDTEWNLAMIFSLLLESASTLDLEHRLLAQQVILRSVHQEINELGLVQEALNHAHKWIASRDNIISRRERYSASLHGDARSHADPNENDRTVTAIANLKTDVDHVIALSQSRGELRLHNIRTGEVVRKITGLKDPIDMKAIDNEDIAILCGRTIQIYNLDDGSHVSNMKGLLSTHVPHFGVHSQTHILALSRNRMCLNSMEINTGDVVTTFKAGEGRFLDSILVAEDGHYCVCGDEVDKPSPLLVWDLEKSQLVYDLRLPQCEFVTSLASITSDGKYVACVYRDICDERSNTKNVVVYDLDSGLMYNKFRASHDTSAVALSGESMNLVQAMEDGRILVWSLDIGNCKHVLRGHVDGADRLVLSADGTRCLSYNSHGHDPSVRLWDIVEGKSLGAYVPDCELVTCHLSLDGSTVAVSLRGLADPVLLCADWSKVQSSGVPFGNPDKLGMEFKVDS